MFFGCFNGLINGFKTYGIFNIISCTGKEVGCKGGPRFTHFFISQWQGQNFWPVPMFFGCQTKFLKSLAAPIHLYGTVVLLAPVFLKEFWNKISQSGSFL